MIGPDDELEEVPHADKELVDQLQAESCAGPLWDRAAIEFARYGWAVISAWLRSGAIAQKCWEKGRRIRLPDKWTIEDQEDLAERAVAEGLEMFRRALLTGRWKPDMGASLRTYFIGGCVLVFPNILRHWITEQQRRIRAEIAVAREAAVRQHCVEPVDVGAAVAALKSLVSAENEPYQKIFVLYNLDYTPGEIAEILGMTPGAVSAAVRRIRGRLGPDDISGEGRQG